MVANYPDLKLYIAGEWRQADGQPVINPADESTLAIVPHASPSSRIRLSDAPISASQPLISI
jgi:acyl-CoA reductase-like NAD-dependent aldehyde dehydrogenase